MKEINKHIIWTYCDKWCEWKGKQPQQLRVCGWPDTVLIPQSCIIIWISTLQLWEMKLKEGKGLACVQKWGIWTQVCLNLKTILYSLVPSDLAFKMGNRLPVKIQHWIIANILQVSLFPCFNLLPLVPIFPLPKCIHEGFVCSALRPCWYISNAGLACIPFTPFSSFNGTLVSLSLFPSTCSDRADPMHMMQV